MNVANDLIGCVIGSCFNAISSTVLKSEDRKKLYNSLEEYINLEFEQHLIRLDIKFDYEGFKAYLENDAVKSIENYLRETDKNNVAELEKSMVTKAIYYSASNGNKQSEQLAQKLMKNVLGIVKHFYVSRVSTGEISVMKDLLNQSENRIKSDAEKNTEKIIAAIEENECVTNYEPDGNKNKEICFSADFPLLINIVIDGRVRKFNCFVDKMDFGVEHSQIVTVATGTLKCTIRNNEYSDLIDYNQSFILSGTVWQIIGMNTTVQDVTILICQKKVKGPNDNLELCISGVDKISSFKIDLFVPIDYLGLGQRLEFTPYLIRDKRVKDVKLCVSNSNEKVLSFDGANITGLSLGKSEISVYWDEDKDICESFSIEVVNESITNIFYRVYMHDLSRKRKSYYDFSIRKSNTVHFGIEKYVNCKLVDTEEVFYFIIVSTEDKSVIPITTVSHCEVEVDTEFINPFEKYLLTVPGANIVNYEIEGSSLY